MSQKSLLFLDIDGVLVTQESMHVNSATRVFCPKAFRLLRRLTEESDCNIVISSTWRIGGSVAGFLTTFEREGWLESPIIGLTPVCDGQIRGYEIDQWLHQHGQANTPYVILDDDTDFLPGQPLVMTDSKKGLTETEYQACLSILSSKPDRSIKRHHPTLAAGERPG